MMKIFLSLTVLFFCLLTACNSPKSGENTQTTDADTASVHNDSTPEEAVNTEDTAAMNQYTNQTASDLIQVETPLPNTEVHSPLTVRGKARGTWYFEGDFPVLLKDKDDNVLAQSPAAAQGLWMTEDFVPFEVTLQFDAPNVEQGYLVLLKDNPSGKPEHDNSYSIPVKFATKQ